jgi:hypothetical protein
VDRGIVMTGGGALIRGLDVLLQQETGLPIHVDEDPLTCVVRGTGRILDDFEKFRSVLSVSDRVTERWVPPRRGCSPVCCSRWRSCHEPGWGGRRIRRQSAVRMATGAGRRRPATPASAPSRERDSSPQPNALAGDENGSCAACSTSPRPPASSRRGAAPLPTDGRTLLLDAGREGVSPLDRGAPEKADRHKSVMDQTSIAMTWNPEFRVSAVRQGGRYRGYTRGRADRREFRHLHQLPGGDRGSAADTGVLPGRGRRRVPGREPVQDGDRPGAVSGQAGRRLRPATLRERWDGHPRR